MPARFNLFDAAEIALSPFLAREQARDAALLGHAEAEARRAAGVCWGGLAPEAARASREAVQTRAAALTAQTRARTFAAGPRGRFLAALGELEALSFTAETEQARAAMRRGFMDEDAAPCPGEIACALLALNPLTGADARAAPRARRSPKSCSPPAATPPNEREQRRAVENPTPRQAFSWIASRSTRARWRQRDARRSAPARSSRSTVMSRKSEFLAKADQAAVQIHHLADRTARDAMRCVATSWRLLADLEGEDRPTRWPVAPDEAA